MASSEILEEIGKEAPHLAHLAYDHKDEIIEVAEDVAEDAIDVVINIASTVLGFLFG